MPETSQQTAGRKGALLKRGAFGLVALAIALLTATGSAQVIVQALYPSGSETSLDCRAGTRALFAATERARVSAPAGEHVSERQALAIFRGALMPEWNAEAALMKVCLAEADPKAIQAFRAVRFLRYAEERHVRTESLDLARKRSVTPALVRALAPSSPSNSPP